MNTKINRIYALASLGAAVLFSVMRIITAVFFTERDTGVYVRGSIFPHIWDYLLFAVVIILILIPCIKRKSFSHRTMPTATKATVFTSAVLGFMFLAATLLILLIMVSQKRFDTVDTILAITGVFAAVYYLSGIFSRGCHAESNALLSMVPIIWTLTALIDVYFDMSMLISSPNRAFHQLALLAFSVFLLAETRMALFLKNTLLYAPAAAISSTLLSATAIPNLVCPHILSIGETDRPIIYAVELAAALYAASKLYCFCIDGKEIKATQENV
ncbi:MAG: hypothetical protein IJ391_08155 [Clostridia bacterium]|nr:hypothetical protein [Clostridia bacterium]